MEGDGVKGAQRGECWHETSRRRETPVKNSCHLLGAVGVDEEGGRKEMSYLEGRHRGEGGREVPMHLQDQITLCRPNDIKKG